MQNSASDPFVKHPIILPASHHFSTLCVRHHRRKLLHAGVRDTLCQLRERFWIIRGRQVVKTCTVCKRAAAKTGSAPFPPLPRDRVVRTAPFENTGVDFAGPLYCRTDGGTSKAYIAAFTCAVTRTVHMELVTDLSTEKFIMTFRRFTARRGLCRVVYSDNAQTFRHASTELRKLYALLASEDVQDHLTDQSVDWKCIVEQAPWLGVFWERIVRTVKNALKVLGKSKYTLKNCLQY